MKLTPGGIVTYPPTLNDFADLLCKVTALESALSHTRGQWIHSIHARECMKALGEPEGEIQLQEMRNEWLREEAAKRIVELKAEIAKNEAILKKIQGGV